MHKGVDFGNDGSTKIISLASGTVARAKVIEGYGNTVTIAHQLNGEEYKTLYAHLKSISVKIGQVVKQSQQIGIKGDTGNATGVHLHFEIHVPKYVAGQLNAVNSLYYIVVTEVVEIQRLLVKAGYKIVVDGIEGPATVASIKAFQKAKRLTPDGIVGHLTLRALKKLLKIVDFVNLDISFWRVFLKRKNKEFSIQSRIF
ncbi:peptidoglycan DD-metalloendopeptidase family protein [Psychrobacillus sp. L3]|uniref:peptidoglycan DD-metalloendopeptidase family protein n=1 Tax=Psychrobacillus sp. L3 TaxID=3236891 RepID=UPI0036F3CC0F